MPSTPDIRAVFFDCDGVLVDTETLGIECARETCRRLGIPTEDQDFATKPGTPDEEWFRRIMTKKGVQLTTAQIEEALEIQFKQYCKYLPQVEFFPGGRELPESLQEQGIPTALVSGSRRFQIDLILQRLALTRGFDTIVTYEDMKGRGKPDPFGYKIALKRVNALGRKVKSPIKPAEVVVLEDTVRGIQSGRNAGMHVIAVKNAGLERLEGQRHVVDSLEILMRHSMQDWLERTHIMA